MATSWTPDIGDAHALGREALHASRLEEAAWLLEAALAARPRDEAVRRDLGMACYRANDFARAAAVLRGLPALRAFVDKLASFADEPPYQLSGPDLTELPFVITDPLPVVEIEAEGRPIFALVDTGGAELILDDEFARDTGVRTFGSQTGTFAGGRQAPVAQGRVESIRLGALDVRRVPVQVLATRRFSPITGGRYQIDGIIGTNLLAQFRPTIDYPGKRLILARSGTAAHVTGVEVPFLMLGDHYMVCDHGWLNGVGPLRFFVDSGLAGGAFTCPAELLQRAAIEVPQTRDSGGVGGGGGPVATGVFHIDELRLGPLAQTALTGVYVEPAAPDADEQRWDGLISHGFLRKYRWTIDFGRSVFVFNEA